MESTKGCGVNKTTKLVTKLTALAVATTVAACSNTATNEATPRSVTPQTSTAAPPTAAPVSAHNHADMMFAHMMIPHHQQAIQMSDMILAKQGIDPRVIDLAKRIKAAQGPEIEQLRGWLNQWGMPGMPGMGDMPGMPGMGDMPGMDGMMSPVDMQALQNAQGIEAGKLFLTQMVKHHQGAIAMAQNEIKDGQSPEAVTMAKSIVVSQQQEIGTMEQILGSL